MQLKKTIKRFPLLNRILYDRELYKYYRNEFQNMTQSRFVRENIYHTSVIRSQRSKYTQVIKLIRMVDFCPVNENQFYYSIDPFKKIDRNKMILDNYSIDYSWVVFSSFAETVKLIPSTDEKCSEKTELINELKRYVSRLYKTVKLDGVFLDSVQEIQSIFSRPARHFHEAIQRILFVNQWLWQTGHKHNGFGHLDWILYELYRKDIDTGYMTQIDARNMLVDFFKALHHNFWYKSTMLLGDTGQIIILGGLQMDGSYRCNELTYLFIDVSRELRLPDPKVLLRVSEKMPDDLLRIAIECIGTGIGAPFLSNDDVVIQSLIQFGYESEDAYGYATSACWEPLIIGKACDQNNIRTVNFCEPFVKFVDSESFENCKTIEDVKKGYYVFLDKYLDDFLTEYLDNIEFEEDPLLTIFNPRILESGKDVTRGGAQYANLGLTSVGMSTVVNSFLNLDRLVFGEKRFALHELNRIRKNNYEGYDNIRKVLSTEGPFFGNDSDDVVDLTNEIMNRVSVGLAKHRTKLGGKYKYGLSSPNYIVDSIHMGATFDGRKKGEPFGVHISGKNGVSPTELLSFSSRLDYKENRINGNVVDFIMSPGFIQNNLDNAVMLIKGGIREGFYQLQINVVDSKTLIDAQKNPDKYPNLVVRVWGFSAYFKDLPKEYQDNLIKRAIDAECKSA